MIAYSLDYTKQRFLLLSMASLHQLHCTTKFDITRVGVLERIEKHLKTEAKYLTTCMKGRKVKE